MRTRFWAGSSPSKSIHPPPLPFADIRGARREGLPPDERRDCLIDVLNGEGFAARWQQTSDGIKLVEYHCPYYLVGQHHPEVCQIDEALIREAVGTSVEKEGCLLSGDQVCTFAIMD